MIMLLTRILNSIIDVEQVSACFKLGVTISIYRGGRKDPLDVNSYRGITVLSKVLESLILNRLAPLLEAGLAHPNQSAYRNSVSCADAIFPSQEVIKIYIQGRSRVYICLYGLQKALF